jgi:predicted MPP superfamily phosphohydrolase
MKHRRSGFLYIATAVWLLVALSWGFVFRQVLYLTDNVLLTWLWGTLSVLTFTPILFTPVDRGRTFGYLTKHLPQSLVLFWIGWILSHLFMTLIFPIFWLVPPGGHFYDYFPILIVFGIETVVFKSVFHVVRNAIVIKVPDLPKNWKPLTILHLSDIHSGPFMRYNHLENLVAKFNKEKFDLCVVTGDVVNHSAAELPWTLELLEKIKSPMGTFAAIGNHEYIDDEMKVIESYSRSKIDLILDSSKFISNGVHKIRLIGVDFPFDIKVTGEREIKKALSHSYEKNPKEEGELDILLSHHPDGFDAAELMNIPLTLAGHTHGGQIEFSTKNTLGYFMKYIRGKYKRGSSYLYVNSGLGNWMPFRINVPCEYTLITVELAKET